MSEQMRKEFEEWASRYHGAARLGVVGLIYSSEAVQHDWNVWQASRQALVVNLPVSVCRTHVFELPHTNEVGMEHDEYYEIDDVKKSLEAAGVRFK